MPVLVQKTIPLFLALTVVSALIASEINIYRRQGQQTVVEPIGRENLTKGDTLQILQNGIVSSSNEVEKLHHESNEPLLIAGHVEKGSVVKGVPIQKKVYIRKVRSAASKADRALLEAAESRDFPGLKTALKSRAFVDAADSFDRTPLMWAAGRSSEEIVEFLIRAKADVNASDARGQTSLMYAIESSCIACVKVLLAAGADQNARMDRPLDRAHLINTPQLSYPDWEARLLSEIKLTESGFTPLIFAAKSNQPEVVNLLLQANADTNILDNFGNSPLIYAAWSSNTQSLRYLIAAGAYVNVQGLHGYSPLVFAVMKGSEENVSILLTANAHANVRIKGGKTVLKLAKETGNGRIINLLRNIGATE